MTKTTITEIIPEFSDLPKWARDAFHEGQFFNVVIEKIKDYESALEFYGDENLYEHPDFLIMRDGGKQAREALPEKL